MAYHLRGFNVARTVWVRNEWRFITSITSDKCTPGSNPVIQSVPDPDPDPNPDIPEDDGVLCKERAEKLWFQFTGGLCADSENEQGVRRGRRLKGGNKGGNGKSQFSCEELNFTVSEGEVVDININVGDFEYVKVIGNDILFEGNPSTGNSSAVPTNMDVIITRRVGSGSGRQAVTLHSSCSGALAIGQSFGSLMFVGFENGAQGPVGYNSAGKEFLKGVHIFSTYM